MWPRMFIGRLSDTAKLRLVRWVRQVDRKAVLSLFGRMRRVCKECSCV